MAVYSADAQLIEDSDRRLKTKKVERKGFLFFRSKKKPKNSDGIPQGDRKTSPRYSSISSPFRLSGSPYPRYSTFKDRQIRYSARPRYSGGSPFSGRNYKVTPRYSFGNPFRGSTFKSSPRYSVGNPFRGGDYKRSIRYSAGSPFKGRDYKVTPRYSRSNPFRGNDYKVNVRYSKGSPFLSKDYRVSPRYSTGMPFRGKDYRITPRYSAGSPFKGRNYNVTPRYSRGMPFRVKDYNVNPRYSRGIPFRGKDFNVKPRYSAGSPFRGVDFKIRPRYTGTKISWFGNGREWGEAKYYQESSLWEGDMKRSRPRVGNQHPSSNYHMAMKFNNPKIRKMFRKWNIFWTRINGNSQNSKGVKSPEKEPKFDKKERVIWNN